MTNITNDRTLCCSDTCAKRFECDRSDINHIGTYLVEDYSRFGTGTYTDDGCEIEHWCGELGDYAMFKPIEEEPEEKIPFPFQYMEKFFLGEIKTFDEAINLTADEVERLLREYAEKHNIKT